MTMDEIARLAGVSKTTVSRVINNKPDVKPETRELIMGLIEKYDFQPNAFAKAISLQKSHNIGLIIPHEAHYIFSNPFYVEVMRGVSTEVNKRGYYLLLCYPHDHNYVDIYKQKRIDGFILMSPGSFHRNIIESLNEVDAPFVATAKILGEKSMIYVDVDNFYGAQLAVEHLVSLGHRRIGFIGKPTLTSGQDRLSGYKAVLDKNNIAIAEDLILVPEISSIKSGEEAMYTLIKSKERPTAVFVANDIMALGAINAAQENGLRVPEDISIVGFDDIPLAESFNPPLTTVKQPAYEKGVKATKMLIQYLEKSKPKSVTLDIELMIRKSTGRVPK
jgi:DNA-binding LacI/PurR family transcriptional regulator